MLVTSLVALVFALPPVGDDAVDLAPGDGLGLDQVAPAVVPVDLPQLPDGRPRSSFPLGIGGLAAVSVLGAGVAAERRRRRSMEPLLVLVHGNGGSADSFEPLLEQLAVDTFGVVAFDWRVAGPGATSTDASKMASAESAAAELDALLRDLSEDHGNIYTIHHSKGGAAGVAMIAALDDGTRPPIDGFRGAALLDPAIARGRLGEIQRFGAFSTYLPDNGGFDPVACASDGCIDVREHLGAAAGVEVIAIRNPDAVLTNFTDDPAGLRVFDLVDDGKPSAMWFWNVPPLFVSRMSEAHASVFDHWAVADCISAEIISAASCAWKGHGWRPRIAWGSAGSRNRMR